MTTSTCHGSNSMTQSQGLATVPAQDHKSRYDWTREALCKIHLDMHCPEWDPSILSELDPTQIVGTVKRAGINVLYFFAKDHYGNAYYNTQIGHKHACIGSRDLLAEVLEEGARQGVTIVAYYSAIWDNHAWHNHPEWRLRLADGSDNKGIWRHVCHYSAYTDYACAMVEEIARNYAVAGFHLDMFNMDFNDLSCYCENCERLFRERTGKPLPRVPQWDETWRQFLEFRYEGVERFARRMRAAAKCLDPDMPVVMNYHGSPNFDWRCGQRPVQHTLYSDLGTGETYTPAFGDMYPGLETRYARSLVPGRPFEMVSWRMNRITDFTLKHEQQMRWELFTSLAGGATVMMIEQPFHNGWLDDVTYEQVQPLVAEIEAKRPLFGGDPLNYLALYYSCKTRDLYGRDRQEKFLTPVLGAYKAFIESHLEVGFVFDENLSTERLAEFPVLFLPNVAILSERECGLLRQYVERGGTLVATFDTSLYSETGERLPHFQLADVFGVNYAETLACDVNYLRNLPGPLGREIHPRYHILNQGSANLVTPTTAEGFGDLHEAFHLRRPPERFFSHNMHPPYYRRSDAVFINRFGRGTAIYLPHQADASYGGQFELPEHRRLLRNLIEAYAPPAPVRVWAPLNVEVMTNRKSGKLMVHLIAYSSLRPAVVLRSLGDPIYASSRMEEPMIYRATIELEGAVRSASVFHPDTRIRVEGNRIALECEQVHEVIAIELEEK